MTDGQRVRARILKVEGGVATLGVYADGQWVRFPARTEVPLNPGDWLTGRLYVPPDGSMVIFKLEETPTPQDSPPTSGLDLEA
ncbi:MAG: hypothetical protein QNK37_17620 [Acidobacteriota bacterium]|nr:hypothetical protein [Acidobacteriota bacterium]